MSRTRGQCTAFISFHNRFSTANMPSHLFSFLPCILVSHPLIILPSKVESVRCWRWHQKYQSLTTKLATMHKELEVKVYCICNTRATTVRWDTVKSMPAAIFSRGDKMMHNDKERVSSSSLVKWCHIDVVLCRVAVYGTVVFAHICAPYSTSSTPHACGKAIQLPTSND